MRSSVCIALALIGLLSVQSVAQTADSDPANQLAVQIGIAGKWKLGHVTPVRLAVPSSMRADLRAIEIESVDGDGVPVTYRTELDDATAATGGEYVWSFIRIGRQGASVSVRAYGGAAADELLQRVELTQEQSKGLASERHMVIALGSGMGIGALSRDEQDGSQTLVVAEVTSVDDMPADWRAFSACDLVVVSTENTSLLNELTSQQWAATETWIRRGGACVVSLGGDGSELPAALLDMIPGTAGEVASIKNPGAIESLVPTESPLRGFEATMLDLDEAQVRLSLRDSLGRELPWWASYSRGHGSVQLVASSLNAPALAQWEDRPLLWQELISSYMDFNASNSADSNSVGDSSYLGYDDVVGQLRATLDVFPGLQVFSFGQLAAILIGILILVGPVDYFVSVRWLKRPELSWYFAGAILLIASVALTWFYGTIRPREIRINTAQIVDIDTSDGRVAGSLWSHVYSGAALTTTIGAEDTQPEGAPIALDWQGLPGRGLGGLMSQQAADRGMPAYSVVAKQGEAAITDVGIPAAGTKSVFGTWNSTVELSGDSSLVELDVVDQLTGDLVNPLDVDLKEPALFYHNWFYSLDSRIPPGGKFTISYDTIPQDINRRLNRRRIVEDADMITPWDPADRNSLDRLLELMMFYKAAKGPSYMSLAHRFHPQLDHSNLMSSEFAVLIARVDEPWGRIQVDLSEGETSTIRQDIDRTWCRLLIPVKPSKN